MAEVEMKQIVVGLSQPVNNLLEILGKKDDIEGIIKNTLKLNLDSQSLEIIHKIIKILTNSNINAAPIHILTSSIEEILRDGKIDTSDIPIIVRMVTELFNRKAELFSELHLRFSDVAIIIKIIISILSNTGVISEDEDKIFKLIDSSLALLETTLILTGVKTDVKIKWCCC